MIHISVEWDGWCNTWRRGVDGVELDSLMPSVATGELLEGMNIYPMKIASIFFPIEKNTQLLIAEL